MTDTLFNSAAALKEEIRQIDVLLAEDPIKAPFDLAKTFPLDLNKCVDLATPLLTTANTGWEAALTARRATLETAFTALTTS